MIKSIVFSATAKDSYKLFLSNFISSLCGFLIITLLTREISVEEIGLFLTAITFSQLVADLFELGLNPASINFLNKGERSYLKASFILKISTVVLVFLSLFLLSWPIAQLIFHNLAILPFIQISAIGAALLILLNWCQTIYQAEKNFTWSSIVIGSSNVFRLLAVGTLLMIGINNSIQNYLAFQIALVFSILLFFWRFGLNFLNLKSTKKQYHNLIKFGLPIGLGFGTAAIYTRLDQIFVFSIAGQKEAAIYGLASRLIIIIVFAVTAFNSAIVIRFVTLEKVKFVEYFKKTYLAILALILLLLVATAMAPVAINLLFGQNFSGAILPFQILVLGIIFFCLALPLQDAILYRYNKPFFSFWISAVSLILVLIILPNSIAKMGSVGAAVVMNLVYFVQLLISFVYYWRIKD